VLVVRPEKGYLAWVADRIFRGMHHPLAVGEKVELMGMTVEITALTADGRPAEAAFRFAVPLEDTSLCWLCYRGKAFEPFTPPAVGESVEIRIGGFLGPGRNLVPGTWSSPCVIRTRAESSGVGGGVREEAFLSQLSSTRHWGNSNPGNPLTPAEKLVLFYLFNR
jgi:hypothetical protein